nr:UpxY family transcription antiterminator [uncultured Prevotella sp.]
MKVDEIASPDVNTVGGGETPPSAGLTSNALPKVQSHVAKNSQTGVSTKNALSTTKKSSNNQNEPQFWYALRTTYGREKKAYDYMTAKGITAFLPTVNTIRMINGKRKSVTESRLPNIFFAYGTEEEIKAYVYDNVNLPFLRFYYRHKHEGKKIEKTPMIVPNSQIDSLKIICEAEAEADDVLVATQKIQQFEKGQLVRIIDGIFKGVVGRVARYKGQQRVAVMVDELMTICTAYVPNVYLEKVI